MEHFSAAYIFIQTDNAALTNQTSGYDAISHANRNGIQNDTHLRLGEMSRAEQNVGRPTQNVNRTKTIYHELPFKNA